MGFKIIQGKHSNEILEVIDSYTSIFNRGQNIKKKKGF